jgi:DNA-binding MarR family transcriptional regulator
MRNEIEAFLSKNPSKSFKASEVAKRLKMPKGEAKKRLKKLAKQGRVAVKKGKYHAPKIEPTDSANWTNRRLEETARRVGISVESLQRWVEEKKRRASEEETKKLLYGILRGVESSQGTKAMDQPEK